MQPVDVWAQPWAVLLDDCGLGGPDNPGGPCTGTYGPHELAASVVDALGLGTQEVMLVGASLLALVALGVLILSVRRSLGAGRAARRRGRS